MQAMDKLRKLKHSELIKVAEVIDRNNFLKKTFEKNAKSIASNFSSKLLEMERSGLTSEKYKTMINGGLLTYLLHCEARVASFLGKGFYTIGPCGEELLGTTSLHLKHSDLAALHYRHVANSVVRQLLDGRSVENIALDRARGYTCSSLDPVTGGKHCSIGGNHKNEFLVTSTLASQAPAALGRALAIPLSNRLLGTQSNFKSDSISYVSLGDGSINNAHFLAAINLAKYCEHNRFKCPLVFVVSDNKKCISLKGTGWVDKFVAQLGSLHHRTADGTDVLDLFTKSKEVIDYSRNLGRPSLLLVNKLSRRFGHAATDRQFAYMSGEEINAEMAQDALSDACSQALQLGIFSEHELTHTFEEMRATVERAFDQATEEPKITSRAALVDSNSQPMVPTRTQSTAVVTRTLKKNESAVAVAADQRPESMRKHMTRVLDEVLGADKAVVYIGEDVEHGGYYLVTDGLFEKYPLRVRNFPPDETTLVAAAIGFSQSGLVPICEIPYAKYLDCAADMFYEAIIANWLSNGKQPNGMVVRLQGFDKGIFGGNYHTHNILSMPPGLDVLCYSNGSDYVKGMRNAVRQAKAGRVVMLVDSTDLLNRRHLVDADKDDFWLSQYPSEQEELSFDDIIVYKPVAAESQTSSSSGTKAKKSVVIVSYGNGVPTALIARKALQKGELDDSCEVTVVDCPYISHVPEKLRTFLKTSPPDYLLFADVCKQGAGMPLGGISLNLQNEGLLRQCSQWQVIGACPTYNPLGNSLTFLSADDIVQGVQNLLK